MTDRDDREREILSQARIGLGPTAAQSEQLRRAIDGAIAAGAGLVAPVPPAARPGHAWSRWLMVSALAAATGAAGYGVGYRAGRAAAPAAPITASTEGATVASPPASRALAAAARDAPPAPQVVAGGGGATWLASSDAGAREPGRRLPPPAPFTAASAAAAGKRARADSLNEVRAIRSIERALRDGQPGLGLALLRELDRAVPNGRLVEEREALSAIARCASGQAPLGVNLGDDFAERHPDSVYLRRVEGSCGAGAEAGGRSAAATDPPSAGN